MTKRKRPPISPTAVKTFMIVVLALTVGLLICRQLYGMMTRSDYFRIKAVILDPSLAFINKREMANLQDKNIFMIDLGKIQRHLSFKYPQVSDLRVLRQLPNQIYIKAKPRHPFAQVNAGEKFLTLDDKGVVLSTSMSRDSGLPFINVSHQDHSRYTLGLPLNGSDYRVGIEIIKFFKLNHALSSYAIEHIHIQGLSRVDVFLANKLNIIFDAAKIDQKVRILGLILAQGKVELKETKYIDLRFKEPIVGKK
jgi:cell division septal protein FtsQ